MPKGHHGNHLSSAHHYRWSEDKIISSHGYAKVRVGVGHPLADPNGYAYEHLLVWVSAGNERPPSGWLLHHKNEVKADNRISNLELKRRTAHSQHHHATLTDEQVRQIREAYVYGPEDMSTLAARFGVPQQRVSKIIRGSTRREAGGPVVLGDKRTSGKRVAGRLLARITASKSALDYCIEMLRDR